MKKLIAVLLILVLSLPVFASAEYLTDHYSLFISKQNIVSGKDASAFDFDSLTVDLYMLDDGEYAYIQITRCVSGIFLNNGMVKVRVADLGGTTYLVDGSGENLTVFNDESSDGLWITLGDSSFLMHRVQPFNMYSDWQ